MDIYTIKKAYPWTKTNEIEITSENLMYSELNYTQSGVQTNSMENHSVIHDKCREIARLIREIEELNND